jgi:hypothetical protein
MNWVDLNHGSGFVYGRAPAPPSIGERIDAFVDQALLAEHVAAPRRDYLGASRIGEAARSCRRIA